ncbi:Glutathione S-transferase [Chondrus crispus]|uniref:Glutathione S-transferase n=1 Tax=Chondrus crispus TaxID=2769 RepID=B1N8I4_CHOCR|nr:Glutathione S-transferase [Chondrus crispus]ABR14710.1 glutathione S-transferase [Chondrus crispus]CDF32358.1 Glutathione S-transferase [Chondrus crispus]|eukprot:XP_005712023.1 Glutathione S-transferase [Chondrus crispus]
MASSTLLTEYAVTLYEMTITRSLRVKWLAAELGILDDITLRPVALLNREQYQAPFKALNPMSAVPLLCLTHKETKEDTLVTESAAICHLLTDQIPTGSDFKPPATDIPAYAAYHRWIAFAAASMDSILWQIRLNEQLLPEKMRSATAAKVARNTFLKKVVPTLEQVFEGGAEFVCEPHWAGFSTADIMVGYACRWSMWYGLLDDSPVLLAYVERVMARKQFKRVFGDGKL